MLNATDAMKYQKQVELALSEHELNISESIKSMELLIQQTIKSQYAMLPPKFLLILEGKKANSRRLIANAFFIFIRVKRRNLLELAIGTWKISLNISKSLSDRPKYRRIAAVYLFKTWVTNLRQKNINKWLLKWQRSVQWVIFIERYSHAIRIQTVYRKWRDRRKFIQMDLVGHFNGLLSDIYLAPIRNNLQYFIPFSIRNSRRLYWLAARILQTRYRCWIQGREYILKRKRIVLLQSIFRMFPIKKFYILLKYTTIKCQAWMRRTYWRNKFTKNKKSVIILQKYTRRYLAINLKFYELNLIWRSLESQLYSAIKIQLTWRKYSAHKKIKKIKLQLDIKQWSALVIQRNYYRMKEAFHTFFLMCAYRQRQIEDIKLEDLATSMGR
jgi:hypothetical protein